MGASAVKRPDGSLDWSGVPTIADVGIWGPATADGSASNGYASGQISGPASASAPAVRLSPPSANPAAAYPFEPGVDPTYDAWLAQYASGKTIAGQDAEQRRRDAQRQHDDAYGTIDQQAGESRKNLTASLLGRGVYRSGETATRQADLEAGVLGQRTQVDTALATTSNGITSDLQNAIAQLDQQNLTQIDQAVARKIARDDALAKLNAPAAAAPQAITIAAPAPQIVQVPAAPPRPSTPTGRITAPPPPPKPPKPRVSAPLTKVKGAQ